jgi:ABC-2 type transport system ATP-binding protein
MEKVLEVNNLTKIYSKKNHFIAVNDLSFHLNEGEILGFLGPNGAGKTTTIQMLLGTLTPTRGKIYYFGQDLAIKRSEILKKVSFASTYLRLPATLSVYENLDIFGRLYGLNAAQRETNIKRYLELFDMSAFRDRKVSSLSAGQMTRVMLAKAFLPEPKVVLLDEPTASLDPDICAEVRSFVIKQQERFKTSMIFTSHNMPEVEEVCDRILVIKNGQIISDQTPEALAKSVSRSKIRFLGIDQERFAHLAEGKFNFLLHGHEIEVEIDEDQFGWLFEMLAKNGISFSHVFINKPSLEDYFLHMTKNR